MIIDYCCFKLNYALVQFLRKKSDQAWIILHVHNIGIYYSNEAERVN